MEAIRKIFPDAQDSVTIDLPPSFRHRLIEVVVMPVDAAPADNGVPAGGSAWPAGLFDQIAGAWHGEPLVRAPQGTADVRAPFD